MEAKDLIVLLKELEASSEIKEQEFLTDGCEDELPEIVNRIVSAAEDVLITRGSVNYNNERILEENGYDVYPGEKDSFGWLSVCIETKKGIIVFG